MLTFYQGVRVKRLPEVLDAQCKEEIIVEDRSPRKEISRRDLDALFEKVVSAKTRPLSERAALSLVAP